MSDRPLDTILAEWRALEKRLLDGGDDVMAAQLAALRDEYAAAFEHRRADAEELGRAPGFDRLTGTEI
jgi:hypothetical protein